MSSENNLLAAINKSDLIKKRYRNRFPMVLKLHNPANKLKHVKDYKFKNLNFIDLNETRY